MTHVVAHRFSVGEALISRTLEPYSFRGCRYLKEMTYEMIDPSPTLGEHLPPGCTSDANDPTHFGRVRARGRFSIEQSSYIKDTGHFNAAEFIIAFNQIFYCALAQAVERGDFPQLGHWSLEEFWEHQLPKVLIQRQSSEYLAPIDSRGFVGDVCIDNLGLVERRHRYIQFEVTITFRGEGNRDEVVTEEGNCRGEDEALLSEHGLARGHVTVVVVLGGPRQ